MNYRFKNLLGAPYRGGNALLVNNSLLISAVGNRISMVDLVKSESSTLPCETSKNITRIAVTPDGKLLLAVDEENRCYLINVHCRVILHRMSFKSKAGAKKEAVRALQFSPDGSLFAVSIGKLVQVWRTPGFKKEFVPFELLRTLTGFNDSVTCLDWSPDGKWIIAGSKDLTARIFNLETKQARPFSLLGHRYVIVSVFFKISKNKRNVEGAYTVSKDGALFDWKFEPREDFGGGEVNADKQGRKRKLEDQDGMEEELIAPEADSEYKIQNGHSEMDIERADAAGIPKEGAPNKAGRKPWMQLFKGTWELTEKRFFMQSAQLTTCDYHRELDLVVVGFGNGIFGLYQMPDFKCIHLLSVTRSKLTTAVFNALGNWLAFGCATLGQMLVWEWRSETYILKQQGHYFDVNCLDYSPDSQMLATGADDNKVKVWNVSSGFCFVTFTEHTNAVTAVHFLPGNHALLSASLDGTVRAWDLLRYRNFRTFTTPSPKQFVSLTSDQSGEVICAGTLDSYEIYVWSMKTGRLLDVLSGHEGPVHGLAFSPTSAVLASSSWDKTVRLWDVFDSKGAVEKFAHSHDVLTVVYRPDGKQLACSTLDGQIQFWNPLEGNFMYVIEGRRDIAGGRLISDRRTAANSSSGKCFTSLCYSADGSFILAAGRSKYICMYSIEEQVLLRRFQITSNLSLDGILDFLNSKQMTDAGPIGLIDDQDSDVEDGLFQQTRSVKGSNLPGVAANHGRPVVSTKCLRISPTGRSWAAATTEGVLMYSLDDDFMFDPTDLDIDVTPEALETALNEKQHLRALLLALRLNEDALIRKCIVSVHSKDIQTVAAAIPSRYLRRVIEAFAECLEGSPHLEFILQWSLELCKVHGHYIQQHSKDFLPALRSLQKALTRLHEDLADTCSSNEYLLKYLCTPLKGIEHE